MGKIRRGGYIFVTWIGDHPPRHVHVYKDGEEIAKFDLENWQLMSGNLSKKVILIIAELVQEGLL